MHRGNSSLMAKVFVGKKYQRFQYQFNDKEKCVKARWDRDAHHGNNNGSDGAGKRVNRLMFVTLAGFQFNKWNPAIHIKTVAALVM